MIINVYKSNVVARKLHGNNNCGKGRYFRGNGNGVAYFYRGENENGKWECGGTAVTGMTAAVIPRLRESIMYCSYFPCVTLIPQRPSTRFASYQSPQPKLLAL